MKNIISRKNVFHFETVVTMKPVISREIANAFHFGIVLYFKKFPKNPQKYIKINHLFFIF